MSASELLSADELDAIRDSISSRSSLTASSMATPDEAEAYDFGSSETVIRSLLPALGSIVERVAEGLRSELLRSLRRELEVIPADPEIQPLPQLMATLEEPCSANLVAIQGLSGTAVLTFDRSLVFALVNMFFGGRADTGTAPNTRDFTDTERRMIQRLRKLSFEVLASSWRDIAPAARCELTREEHNPQFLVQHNSAEVLVVCPLEISFEEPAGQINIAFPFSMLEPLRDQLLAEIQNQHASPDGQLVERWQSAMQSANVLLRCPLASTEISLGELLQLKAGDVLPVELPNHAQLEVEDVVLFEGSYGVWQGSRAVKIAHILSRDPKRTTDHDRKGKNSG